MRPGHMLVGRMPFLSCGRVPWVFPGAGPSPQHSWTNLPLPLDKISRLHGVHTAGTSPWSPADVPCHGGTASPGWTRPCPQQKLPLACLRSYFFLPADLSRLLHRTGKN